MNTEHLTTLIIGPAVAVAICRFAWSYLHSPLKSIPGPFWAKFTDLWRFVDFWNETQITSHQELHEKHGVAVRLGPNLVSISDPSLLKTIYSSRGDYLKGDFYEVADAVGPDGKRIEGIFSTRSKTFHDTYMRPYRKYFQPNVILASEGLMDKMEVLMCQQLEQRFMEGTNAGKIGDLAMWIEYLSWDLNWQLTFNQDMGFLRSGADVKDMIHTGEMIQRYLGCVGQMPWLDRMLGKNPYCPIKFPTFTHAANYSFQRIQERAESDEEPGDDFLSHFLEAKEQYPDLIGNNELVSYLMMNVLAGADTTAIVQKSIVSNILTHRNVYDRLREEFDATNISFPAKYDEIKNLPYLTAVIREGMRIHPVISGVLERVVPEGGLKLHDGRFLPAGTKVGSSGWVLTRNKAIFGEDVEAFRPERWLRGDNESEEDYETRLRAMRDIDFTFGAGSRICVGRHMATIALYKSTATLFSRYDIELDQGSKYLSVRNWWFTFIDDIWVKFKLRPGVPSCTN